jgi:hypothetical protein
MKSLQYRAVFILIAQLDGLLPRKLLSDLLHIFNYTVQLLSKKIFMLHQNINAVKSFTPELVAPS